MNLGPTPYRLPEYSKAPYTGPDVSEETGVQQTEGVSVPSDYDSAVESSAEVEQITAEEEIPDPFSVLGENLPSVGGVSSGGGSSGTEDETLVLEAETFTVPPSDDIIDGGDY